MNKTNALLIVLSCLFFIGCGNDDNGNIPCPANTFCDDECPNAQELCDQEYERINWSSFSGTIFYCNAQAGQASYPGEVKILGDDTGALILLHDETASFIDTSFHASFICTGAPECLFGTGDFIDENDQVILTYEGGSSTSLRSHTFAYDSCEVYFRGSLNE